MTLKEIQNKLLILNLFKKDKNKEWFFTQKLTFFIYTALLFSGFTIYTITYNSINNKKIENEKNLEIFFNSEELSINNIGKFNKFHSQYIEFNYNIENNDSIGKILKI